MSEREPIVKTARVGRGERDSFSLEGILPVLVVVENFWKNLSLEEKIFFASFPKVDIRSKEEKTKPLAEAVLERLSWLLPPENIDGLTHFFRKICFHSSPGLGERYKEVLSQRLGLGEEKKTLESIGRDLGVSRERIRQLENAAETKVLSGLGEYMVQTLTGERKAKEVILSNLWVIFEEFVCHQEMPVYQVAPSNLFQTLEFLKETAITNFALREEMDNLPLSPPYDFLFARQVLLPLSRLVQRPQERYYFVSDATKYIRKFKEQLSEEIFWEKSLFQVLPSLELGKEPSVFRRLTPEDFGGGALGTHIRNCLSRAGISTPYVLIKRRTLVDLRVVRGVGRRTLERIYEFLLKEYPQEEIARELEMSLAFLKK